MKLIVVLLLISLGINGTTTIKKRENVSSSSTKAVEAT
ncbi:hypothetical protein GCK32_013470 [Trichostrongylus colubriformis]|uniref:Uncharacterized protein n=1 Tax=Trichostrongylus colubriformis TaxID=6319 RepID=A0AAN8FTK5_TRICO